MNNFRIRFLAVALPALGMMLGYGAVTCLGRLIPSAYAGQFTDPLSTQSLELVDAGGNRKILMAMATEGCPAIWFFDKNGKARLTLGLYEDGNAGVVLNDENEQAVQIFRTRGPRSTPFLVMKSNGQDRIVMGLDNDHRDPFLCYMVDGQKKMAFGSGNY